MAMAAGLCFLTVTKTKTFWCFFEPKKIIYLRKRKTYSGANKASHTHATLPFQCNDFRKLRSRECFPCTQCSPGTPRPGLCSPRRLQQALEDPCVLGCLFSFFFFFKGHSSLGDLLFRLLPFFETLCLKHRLLHSSDLVMHTLVAW